MDNDNNYEIILKTPFGDEWHYPWYNRKDAVLDKYIFGGTLYLKDLFTGKTERI